MNRRDVLRSLGAAGLLGLAGVAGASHETPTRDGSDQPTPTEPPECALPVFTDEYLGFHVGRPDGWEIQYAGGIIWQAPEAVSDPSDDFGTVAFVYPGQLQNASIETVAGSFVDAIDQALSPTGSLALSAGGELGGTYGSQQLVGRLWTETRDTYALLWGGFGTPASWEATRDAVAETGRCFDIFPGETLAVRTVTGQDQFGRTTYQYVVPESWTVSGVNSVGIDIVGEVVEGLPRAHVGYGTYSLPSQWSVEQAIQTWLNLSAQSGHTVTIQDGWDLGTTRDALGYEWQQVLLEYTRNAISFQTSGQQYFGYHTIAVLSVDTGFGSGYATTLSWGREALTDQWDRLAAITSLVQSNIQIVSRRPGQLVSPSVAQTNDEISDIIMDTWEAQNAADDRMQQQYVDTIWERDRVQNPENPNEQALVSIHNTDPTLCGDDERPVYNPANDQWECWPLV